MTTITHRLPQKPHHALPGACGRPHRAHACQSLRASGRQLHGPLETISISGSGLGAQGAPPCASWPQASQRPDCTVTRSSPAGS